MSISGNYSHPIIVNGFSCINCAEVAEAKAGIDPANPAAGPGGAKAANKAGERYFAAQARDPAELARRHAEHAGSPIAAAYAGGVGAPGRLVSVSA